MISEQPIKHLGRSIFFLFTILVFSSYPPGSLYEPPPHGVPHAIPKRLKISKRNPLMQYGGRIESRFHRFIMAASGKHRVDPALVEAVIMAESNYDPLAVSNKGAVGLMQLMPNTADALGLIDYFNPELNINAGVKYLRQLLNQFEGDVQLALAAYNAGSKEVRKHRGVPPYKSTRVFVEKVLEYYGYCKGKTALGNNNV